MTGGRSRPGAPAFLVQVKERQSQFTGLQTREAADLPPASQGPLEDVHGTAVPFPCLCEDTCRRAPHRLGTERPHHGSEGTGLRGGTGTLEYGCPRKHPRVPSVSPGRATAHTAAVAGHSPSAGDGTLALGAEQSHSHTDQSTMESQTVSEPQKGPATGPTEGGLGPARCFGRV